MVEESCADYFQSSIETLNMFSRLSLPLLFLFKPVARSSFVLFLKTISADSAPLETVRPMG